MKSNCKLFRIKKTTETQAINVSNILKLYLGCACLGGSGMWSGVGASCGSASPFLSVSSPALWEFFASDCLYWWRVGGDGNGYDDVGATFKCQVASSRQVARVWLPWPLGELPDTTSPDSDRQTILRNSPVELRKMSPGRVLAYRILRPRMAFWSVRVSRLTYLRVLVFTVGR